MNIYDNLKIASYAAAADAFDKSQDIFMGFLPLVEAALCSSADVQSIPFLALQQKVNEIYGVQIPKDTLRRLVDILEDQGKLRFMNGKTIWLVNEWLGESISTLDSEKSVTEELFSNFQLYLAENDHSASVSDLRSQICEWIYTHSSDLAKFVASETQEPYALTTQSDEWAHAESFIDFLIECHSKKPSIYNTFVSIYDGAVQASLLNFRPKDIDIVADSDFLVKNAILDTNFILRLIGLQAPLDNEVAQSTLQTLHDVGTKFFVLYQTVEEVCTSIRGFLREIEPISQHAATILPRSKISTSGFWSAFQNGVTRTDFSEWTNPEKVIETLSSKFSISIVEDYEDPSISSESILDLIKYKENDRYAEKQAKHDLLLISYCRKQRAKRIRSLSDAVWWILTNDIKLTSWNKNNSGTYQECITAVQISNLLWLYTKKDNGNGLTNTIMSLASHNAVSTENISDFAAGIDKYSARYNDNPKLLENLANVLANSVLSTYDLKNAGTDEDTFFSVIDKKAKEIHYKQEKEKASQIATERAHTQQITELHQQVEYEKISNEKQQLEGNIKSTHQSIGEIKKRISQVQAIQTFCKEKEPIIGRWLLVITLILFAAIAGISVLIWEFTSLRNIMPQLIKIAEPIATLTGSGVLLICISSIGFIVTTAILGTPHNFKDLFLILRNKWVLNNRGKYILQNNFLSEYANGSLDFYMVDLENQLKQEENNLQSLEEALHKVEGRLTNISPN